MLKLLTLLVWSVYVYIKSPAFVVHGMHMYAGVEKVYNYTGI